jgi:processive 1,2-diacylglycerol beta-glucosyltransferase
MSAANALRAVLAQRDPEFTATVVDSYKYAASVVSRVVSDGYLGMVKTIPQMYRFLYNRAERATQVGPFRTWVHQFTAGNLRPALEQMRPDIVVCTHAFPCGAMAEYKRQFADSPPVFGVVTDFAVHTFWIHKNVDGYAVATDEMRNMLLARGVAPERVIVSGIPIHPAFGEAHPDRSLLRERLGLPRDRQIVLLMGGGLGIGPLVTMMEAVSAASAPVCAVAIVGHSSKCEQSVLQYADHVGYPVRVVRFVENVHEYMHASDLLITKPGGLTCSEALAAGLPMILFKPLPGQEERNTRYLVQRHAALRAKGERDLAGAVASLLASPEKREQMRCAMRSLAKPEAAVDVANAIRAIAGAAKGEAIA